MIKAIAISILSTMALGLMPAIWTFSSWVAGIEIKVNQNGASIQKLENTDKDISQKIDDIHWHLIESKGVQIPNRRKKNE